MRDKIKDEESTRLETEIRILDCARWAIKDHPERAWEVLSKIIEDRSKKLNDLHHAGPVLV